jgi:hypothetical protein
MKNKLKSRILSLLAIMTIGEGIVLIFFPNKHLKAWRMGPRFLRNFTSFFINNPWLTKTFGALEAVFGLWIGSKIGDR